MNNEEMFFEHMKALTLKSCRGLRLAFRPSFDGQSGRVRRW